MPSRALLITEQKRTEPEPTKNIRLDQPVIYGGLWPVADGSRMANRSLKEDRSQQAVKGIDTIDPPYTLPMAMGTRKRDRQPSMRVTTTYFATAASHPFYTRLNQLLARIDRKRQKKGANRDWTHPHDPDAKITKMKDGRTHLAHKAEYAVDRDTGAIVGIS